MTSPDSVMGRKTGKPHSDGFLSPRPVTESCRAIQDLLTADAEVLSSVAEVGVVLSRLMLRRAPRR